MKVHYSHNLDGLPNFNKGCVFTAGNFDGLHRGHQAIIAQARQVSRQFGLPLVAMTFEPAPLRLLDPEKAPPLLTPLELKIQLLQGQDIDHLVVIKTTREFLSLTAKEFIENILVRRLNVKHIVEGTNFTFGSKHSGNMSSLKDFSRKFGFQVHPVPPVSISSDNHPPLTISSTVIRTFIQENKLEQVRSCLGRDYALAGKIVSGRGTGHKIGFPTLNFQPHHPAQLIPPDGVFAGFVRLGRDLPASWAAQTEFPAAISIGPCATFADGYWQIEAYLLDFDPKKELFQPITDNNYYIIMTFSRYIRPQKRFASVDDLKQAISQDCRIIRQVCQR